jgi:predicted metalloprotease with PDZ domain
LLSARGTTRSRAAYTLWLTTVSHEIFHLWNGKRLRPVELGPFDYEREALTRSLWVVEGLTDYYGDLLTHRAGLTTEDEFLASLSSSIADLQTTPGRQIQSVELASYDAWIRYYRPDENSPNVSISYYVKGQILGFILDAHIRRLTNGARSLDDVMRMAYARYSGERGFTPEQFREVAEKVSGAPLADFWSRWVKGTDELQYTETLATFGLRFLPGASGGRPSLGVSTRNDQGRLVVTQVGRQAPATPESLNADDEILAIEDRRVRADALARRLDSFKPGDRISVLVARRDQLLRLQVVLETSPPYEWELAADPAATETQRMRRSAWLKPPV